MRNSHGARQSTQASDLLLLLLEWNDRSMHRRSMLLRIRQRLLSPMR
jgi:hypothetical protein